MFLVDTSVWVEIFRDQTREKGVAFLALVAGAEYVLSRFVQLELLQGCRDEEEWDLLSSYLDSQDYCELSTESWPEAARIYYDLRRAGLTVRSPIDCCIAQLAIEHDLVLIHRDRDFEAIAEVRALRQVWLQWEEESAAPEGSEAPADSPPAGT